MNVSNNNSYKNKTARSNRRQPTKQPGNFHDGRGRLIGFLAMGSFILLLGRGAMITLFPSEQKSLDFIANAQYQKRITLAPYRGAIYDRRGEPLAISIRKPSIVVNPGKFSPTTEQTRLLSRYLGVSRSKIKKLASKTNQFAWLKRQTNYQAAQNSLNLDIDGISLIREPGRFYPAGKAAAHLLGFVGTDNNGLIGLEGHFDKDLRGQPITITPTKDAKKRTIYKEASVRRQRKPATVFILR